MGIKIFELLLKKSILGLLWFVHDLQFWLMVLEGKLNQSATNNSDYGCGEDPFCLVKKGAISLLCLSYLGVARFCFRFTQLIYLSTLSVYVYLGFKEPVPLAILNGLKSNF